MRILLWHVHGSWTTAFVQGSHTYLLPCVPDRGPDGRGRAQTWTWPASAVDVPPTELADTEIDVVILQRCRDVELARRWLGGRVPGRDVPVIWLEHNAPQGRVNDMRHPAADRGDVTVVHVTHTNALFWDTGATRSVVIEHGIVDPGERWTGDERAAAVVVNEPVRRARVAGTDLLPALGAALPSDGHLDVFGMGMDELVDALGAPSWLRTYENVPQRCLHEEVATRRCYVHPYRWTSLGLALVEAMHLGMPVVGLATTDAHDAVPAGCGLLTNDVAALGATVAHLLDDIDHAAELGHAARRHALSRYGLGRFLADWDRLLEDIT